MNGLVRQLVTEAAAPLKEIGASLGRKAALFFVTSLCGLIAIIIMTIALYLWLVTLIAPPLAALAVAGPYLLAAIIAYVLATRRGRGQAVAAPVNPERAAQIDELVAPILTF